MRLATANAAPPTSSLGDSFSSRVSNSPRFAYSGIATVSHTMRAMHFDEIHRTTFGYFSFNTDALDSTTHQPTFTRAAILFSRKKWGENRQRAGSKSNSVDRMFLMVYYMLCAYPSLPLACVKYAAQLRICHIGYVNINTVAWRNLKGLFGLQINLSHSLF